MYKLKEISEKKYLVLLAKNLLYNYMTSRHHFGASQGFHVGVVLKITTYGY